jgi:hypothetical protein
MPCHPFVQSYHAHKTVNKTRTSPPFPCGYPKLALMKQKDHVQLRTMMESKYRQISIDTGGCTRLFGRWVGGGSELIAHHNAPRHVLNLLRAGVELGHLAACPFIWVVSNWLLVVSTHGFLFFCPRWQQDRTGQRERAGTHRA